MLINKLKSSKTLKIILIVLVLSALSFNRAFNFYFFFDDWYQILGVLYYQDFFMRYLIMHPVSILEFKFLASIFGFNPYPYQFTGYLLKAIGALSMWPLMLAITNSKRAALYACLIFSVFAVGTESYVWASAHSSAIVIPLISFGFYFWIKSISPKSVNFFIGLSLFTLSILGEPGRSYMLIILATIWELLSLYQKLNFKNTVYSLSKLICLFLLVPLTGFITNKFFAIPPDISIIFKQFSTITNYNLIGSLKDLLLGWTLIPEQFRYYLTLTIFFALAIFVFLFVRRRQNEYKIIIFLLLWPPLFYVANYLARLNSVLGGGSIESRYYAISAVGIVGLLAYAFSFIKMRMNWLLVLFLVFNLYVTNQILLKYASFRSVQINNKIWDKIEKDVPQEEKDSVFMFTGGDSFSERAELLDWNDTIPFAVRRKIEARREEYPLFTNDKLLISKLICDNKAVRRSALGDFIQKEPLPLSHVHAWELKKGELENRSEQERDGIKKIAKCLQPG